MSDIERKRMLKRESMQRYRDRKTIEATGITEEELVRRRELGRVRAQNYRARMAGEGYKAKSNTAVSRAECRLCPTTKNIEIHHIRPRRFKGDDSDENLIALCKPCHKVITNYHREVAKIMPVDPDKDIWRIRNIHNIDCDGDIKIDFCDGSQHFKGTFCSCCALGWVKLNYCWCSDTETTEHDARCLVVQKVWPMLTKESWHTPTAQAGMCVHGWPMVIALEEPLDN